MKRAIPCALIVAATGMVASAQQATPVVAPMNDQGVQYYRALLAAGGTQAVIQAVTAAVLEAMKQGPLTGEVGRATLASGGAPAVPTTGTSAAALAPVKTWADSITLKGDLRYRTETRKDNSKADVNKDSEVEYDRLRARVGLEAKVADNVKAIVRLTTDSSAAVGTGGDPISGNQDLNNGGTKKSIYLDMAYLDWNFFGEDTRELHGLAGKMANPFIAQPDDLVWDPDLTPEGLALKGQYDLGSLTLLGNAGYFILNNQNNDAKRDNQISMYGAQGAARYEFMPELSLTLGMSYFGFNNIQDAAVVDVMHATPSGFGNTTYTSGGVPYWKTGFDVIQPFAQVDAWVYGLPVSLYAQAVENTSANDQSQGHMYGLSLGKAKNPGTFELGASYAKLEKDATLGMWTDSDRWGGGTDGSGFKYSLKYQIMKGLQAGLTYFNDAKGISGNHGTKYERVQADLTATF